MKEDQARLEREKRNKLKQKRLDRLRFEKEKAAAERLESEREAQEAALQAAAQLAESEEAARYQSMSAYRRDMYSRPIKTSNWSLASIAGCVYSLACSTVSLRRQQIHLSLLVIWLLALDCAVC